MTGFVRAIVRKLHFAPPATCGFCDGTIDDRNAVFHARCLSDFLLSDLFAHSHGIGF